MSGSQLWLLQEIGRSEGLGVSELAQRLSIHQSTCSLLIEKLVRAGYVRKAREQGIPIKTFTIPMHDVDRAITDGEDTGFVKIHVKEKTDRILGATIVGRHAGEMINEITLAMIAGIGLRVLARVIHAYPTQAEAVKKAADAYTRSRLTPTVQSLLRRWLAW